MNTEIPLLEKYKDLIYLDNAATTQKPREVLDAMQKFYEESNANVHRGLYTLAQKATMEYEKSREIIAQFIAAETEEIIFTRGTTESLNLLAVSLGKKLPTKSKNLQAGDEIVLTEMEHHSNIVPWQQLAKEKKLVLKFIPVTSGGVLDMAEAQKMITPRTKIVSVMHMSNVLGTINPIPELAGLAHRAGALFIVDAAQSVPHMPVDVKELGCDFLAFSGHKMCGPTGIGVLWGKKALLEEMEPVLYGGDMVSEVTLTEAQWNAVPWKFEAGTPNVVGVIGLAAAVQFLQKKGMKDIQKHGQELTVYALEQLAKISGLKILGSSVSSISSASFISSTSLVSPASSAMRGPAISFTLEGVHPHDLSEICNRYHIAVRAGHHCTMPLHQRFGIPASTRISLYWYNTRKDIDAVIVALRRAQAVFHD